MSQVANQVIPEGYKKTEVGVIPEDWSVKSFGDCFSIISGLGFSKSEYTQNGLNLLRIDNVSYGKIIWDSIAYLPEGYAKKYPHLILEVDDLLLALNRPITNGQLKLAKLSTYDLPSILYQRVGKISASDKNIDLNFAFFLLTKFIKLFVEQSAVGTDQPFISTTKLKKCLLPIPNKAEQTAIANALSDVDALLSELEKLIAKKQAIKTATMQQLLTGKTRLPQFATYTEDMPEGKKKGQPKGMKASDLGEIPEDWKVVTLDDAADFLDGQRRPIKSGDRAKIKGQYPYYGASGIVDYVNDFIFDGEFILLGEDGENILSRNLPLAFKAKGKIWVNNHAHVMTTKENFHIDFLIPYLESLDYSLLNSGTAQPKLNKQSCLSLKVIKLPLEEQAAIASILSDMDNEIQALQQRLSKTRQIKQGMMQDLLTGKTRLPFDKAKEQGEAHAD